MLFVASGAEIGQFTLVASASPGQPYPRHSSASAILQNPDPFMPDGAARAFMQGLLVTIGIRARTNGGQVTILTNR